MITAWAVVNKRDVVVLWRFHRSEAEAQAALDRVAAMIPEDGPYRLACLVEIKR